ncbi:hypothetical protein M0802_000613 [Mischocyttarus mexicanus]|nr:hypothetical protein M0802_000613 [Mischocyttarus mexicanus]
MAVRVVLPGTPPGTATLPPRTVPLIPVPPHDTLPSPPSDPPPATGAPDDAVDAVPVKIMFVGGVPLFFVLSRINPDEINENDDGGMVIDGVLKC